MSATDLMLAVKASMATYGEKTLAEHVENVQAELKWRAGRDERSRPTHNVTRNVDKLKGR